MGNIIPKSFQLKIVKIGQMPLNVENKSKIAVFGSAFNPPSLGHKSAIESLGHFDKVILLPSISHAWGKEMLSFEVRCTLVTLFIKDIDSTRVELSTIEKDLYRPERSVTTFEVLSKLQQEYPNAELSFVIGPDNLLNFSKFSRYEEILARWSLIVCPEKLPVRSTHIRHNLKTKLSIAKMVTPSVEMYLLENNLY